MSERAQKVIALMFEGKDVRTAISEIAGIKYASIADDFEKNAQILKLAKDHDEKGLIAYIYDNMDALNPEIKITRREIRKIARELVSRQIAKAGGK